MSLAETPTPKPEETTKPKRIYALDMLRGFCVVLMVAFHAFFMIGYVFAIEWGQTLFVFFQPVEPFFAGLFILIAGISSRLSHSNWKRGLRLVGLAAVITLGTFLAEYLLGNNFDLAGITIWFGILHFLAVAILFFALTRRLLDYVHPVVGIVLCVLLLCVFLRVGNGLIGIGPLSFKLPPVITDSLILYPMGMHKDLIAGDYFPVFPWIFIFLVGTFIGVYFKKGRLPAGFYRNYVPALTVIGRSALIIYVAHQPAIGVVVWLIQMLRGMFV